MHRHQTSFTHHFDHLFVIIVKGGIYIYTIYTIPWVKTSPYFLAVNIHRRGSFSYLGVIFTELWTWLSLVNVHPVVTLPLPEYVLLAIEMCVNML